MANMGRKGFFCPECGTELFDHDLDAHAENHWPAVTDPRYMGKEAAERKAKVLAGGSPKGASA